MARSYNFENIRNLLTEGFTDRQLRRFCFDTPHFRPVYDQFAQNSGQDEIVDHILDYAIRTLKVELLLAWAKRRNPARYREHQPYYGRRILLVDDNKDWCDQLGGLLQEREDGYEVVIAMSSQEAIQLIRSDIPYNLVILDMRLDESDKGNREGMSLGEWLRDNGYNMPIIIMSAHIMEPDTIKKMTLRPFQFVAVEKGKIGSGKDDDLLYQIELALS
ncbi:MAG: response regulator [Anaerolineales bacterium]|nr:response regulator [Anaerolineales bacterium]